MEIKNVIKRSMDHDTDLVDGHYIEMDLRNKTTSEFRTGFDSPLGVPNS